MKRSNSQGNIQSETAKSKSPLRSPQRANNNQKFVTVGSGKKLVEKVIVDLEKP